MTVDIGWGIEMRDKEDMEFWLKKRGYYPRVIYRGGAMKAIVCIEIPLDEIAEFYHTERLKIGDKWMTKKEGQK